MKTLRILMIVGLFTAGVVLLVVPLHAQAFAPTRFTVVDAGTAGKPDVVLIPGLSSSRAVWDVEAKRLAPNYRLHLVQIDGFAGAPVGPNESGPILVPVVDELHAYIIADKMHPAVIGHSLGGFMALMLADKYPADVSKIVIVDSLPYDGLIFDPEATVETMAPKVEIMKSQIIGMPADQYAAMQPMMAAQFVKNADAQKLVAAASLASDRAVTADAMADALTIDLRSHLASIKTPTLMLYPTDTTAHAAQIDALYVGSYKAMPNVHMVRIDDSRHFIMYDQPEKMDAVIEAFLK
jgi:pimeloyl-ACP methyl ester carboxylesterase